MKKLIILTLIVVSFANCSSEFQPSSLLGSWVIKKMEANTPDISPAILKGAEEEAYSMVYEFLEDGKFKMTSNAYPDGALGTYTLNLESNHLKVSFKGSEDINEIVEEYQISELSDDSMKWTMDLREMGNIVFTINRK